MVLDAADLPFDSNASAAIEAIVEQTVGSVLSGRGIQAWDDDAREFVFGRAEKTATLASRLAHESGSSVISIEQFSHAVQVVFERARRAERRSAA